MQSATNSDTDSRQPKIRIEPDAEAVFIALRLAKKGYYSGNPDAVLNAPIDTVLNILHFEKFENEIEKFYHRLNNENS